MCDIFYVYLVLLLLLLSINLHPYFDGTLNPPPNFSFASPFTHRSSSSHLFLRARSLDDFSFLLSFLLVIMVSALFSLFLSSALFLTVAPYRPIASLLRLSSRAPVYSVEPLQKPINKRPPPPSMPPRLLRAMLQPPTPLLPPA